MGETLKALFKKGVEGSIIRKPYILNYLLEKLFLAKTLVILSKCYTRKALSYA